MIVQTSMFIHLLHKNKTALLMLSQSVPSLRLGNARLIIINLQSFWTQNFHQEVQTKENANAICRDFYGMFSFPHVVQSYS